MNTLRFSIHRVCLAAAVFLTLYLTAAVLPAGEIHKAAAAGDLGKVKTLLEADATLLDAKDDNGDTPLYYACIRHKVAVANFFIEKGADVNSRNNSGFAPLHAANSTYGQDLDLIQRLVAKGADVNARGSRDETPLYWAAQRGNIQVVKFLIDHGADFDCGNAFGSVVHVAINKSQELAKLLVERGAPLNQRDSLGLSELHMAALNGYADLARLLIERGMDIDALDGQKRTALYYAAKHGYRKVADALIAGGAKAGAIVEANYGKAPQLGSAMKEGEAHVWYLGGFAGTAYAVKTKNHLLLFNPPGVDESLEAGLANGHLNPSELAGLKIAVLVTFPESEPYELAAFELAKRVPGTSFAIGFKPSARRLGNREVPAYRQVARNESFSIGDIQMHTIPAVGGGVAYLVEADGVKVFHAGYHSYDEAANAERYRKEIDALKAFGPIDAAILPVGGHVKATPEPYLYLVDQLSPKAIYLMSGNYRPDEYPKYAEVLRMRRVQVSYPEGRSGGDRFHYVREQTAASASSSGASGR
jgi:ankyrin repeat protein